MNVGIVLDRWKLPIFREILDREGYDYKEADGINEDSASIIVTIDFSEAAKLRHDVNRCNAKAAESKQ